MKAFVIASALAVMAVAPAAAQQSCVMNGAFVPCPGNGMGMGGGMNGGMMNNGMGMQSGQQGMMNNQGMQNRRMTRAEMRRMKRMQRMQGQDGGDQM